MKLSLREWFIVQNANLNAHTVKIPEMIAGNDIYDYNYYITEEDDYCQPKIGDNNFEYY